MKIINVNTIVDPSDAETVYNVRFKLNSEEEYQMFKLGQEGVLARSHVGFCIGTYIVRFLREYINTPENQKVNFCKKVMEYQQEMEIHSEEAMKAAWNYLLNKNQENNE